jgi:hypothetical protein
MEQIFEEEETEDEVEQEDEENPFDFIVCMLQKC